jgi:hypothetical protein
MLSDLRQLVRVLLAAALIVLPAFSAEARRVALVIGNSAYENQPLLDNPRNDARDIARTLRDIGFDEVREFYDISQRRMLVALREFSIVAAKAETALVYFAGHGVEVDGRNYLIPVDAALARATDVEFEAVALDNVRTSVSGAARLRIVILDACRNNPFKLSNTTASRSVGRGLARVEAGANEIVAYAAREGTLAADGVGLANSPYAAALIKNLQEPGLDIRMLFGRVRDDVWAATNKSQEPFYYGSLGGQPVFLHPPAKREPAFERAPLSEMAEAWRTVKDSSDVAVLGSFIRHFGDSFYADLARARIKELTAATEASRPREQNRPPIAPSASPPTSLRAVNDERFVRAVQMELKRIGCFAGEPDGRWGQETRKGFETYARATNAAHTDEPDFETLEALRNLPNTTCRRDENSETAAPVRPRSPAAKDTERRQPPKAPTEPTAKSAGSSATCNTPKGRGGTCTNWMFYNSFCVDACGRTCSQNPSGRTCW